MPTEARSAARRRARSVALARQEYSKYAGAKKIAKAYASVVENATSHYINAMEVSLVEVFRQVTNESMLDVEDRTSVMLHSLLQNTNNRRHRMITIHTIAGQEALAAALAVVPRAKRASIPRQGRYANGFLERAIKNPANITATHDGVGLFRPAILDNAAAHWYRLNFGAGNRGRAGGRPGSYNIRFANQVIGSISLADNRPSPDFQLPAGSFINGQFFTTAELARAPQSRADRRTTELADGNVVRIRSRRNTQGITGKNYMDAAAKQLAKSVGDGWSILFREWLEEAAKAGTSPTAHVVTAEQAKGLLAQIGSRNAARNQAALSRFKSEFGRV